METLFAVLFGLLIIANFTMGAWLWYLEGKIISLNKSCRETQKLFNEYEGDITTLIEWISDNVEVTWEQQQELDSIRARREGTGHEEYTEGEVGKASVEKKA